MKTKKILKNAWKVMVLLIALSLVLSMAMIGF